MEEEMEEEIEEEKEEEEMGERRGGKRKERDRFLSFLSFPPFQSANRSKPNKHTYNTNNRCIYIFIIYI